MTPGSVLERPESAVEGLTLIQVPDTLPQPVRDDQCPKGGDHDWQGKGDHWECSKCGQTATLDS
jgi:hypothetical protein